MSGASHETLFQTLSYVMSSAEVRESTCERGTIMRVRLPGA